jgi:hypothetical protein
VYVVDSDGVNNMSSNTGTFTTFEEQVKLNFISRNQVRLNFNNSETLTFNLIPTQNDVSNSKLPIYFWSNIEKMSSIINKQNINNEQVQKKLNNLINNLSELKFDDVYLEITKTDLIKFSILLNDNKILIISKDISDETNLILYSFFINSQMIASNVCEIAPFVKKFKEFMVL